MSRAALVLGALLLLGMCSVAMADIIPPECTANQMNLDVTKSAFQIHDCDTVTYTVTAFNGDFPPACQVNDVTITFYPPGADGSPDMGAGVVLTTLDTFPPSRTETYPPIDVAVCVNPGVVFAQALAVWTGDLQDAPSPDPQTGSKTVTVTILNPEICVTKTATPLVSKADDIVDYEICVENCGEATLDNITVIDSLLGDLSDAFADSLLVGESECHTFSYIVKPGDPNPLVNEVIVEGTDVTGTVVTDMDDAEVHLVYPDFTITKECYPDPLHDGDVINWRVTLHNTGDVALMITVVDAVAGISDTGILDAGQMVELSRERTVVCPDDAPAISNEVVATATLVGVDLPNVLERRAMASCQVICEGPTRTPGYWFTHPEAMAMALAEECGDYIGCCLPDGPDPDDLDECMFLFDMGCCNFDIEDAMRVFWLGNRELEPKNRRTLGMHIIAAMCNACLLGTEPPAGIIEAGIEVFCDPCATAMEIGDAIEPLDWFNNSGDDLDAEILQGLNADPRTAKELASMGDICGLPTCVSLMP